MTKYFVISPSYLILQHKLLYFALSTLYFGQRRSFGGSRDGGVVRSETGLQDGRDNPVHPVYLFRLCSEPALSLSKGQTLSKSDLKKCCSVDADR